MIWWLASDSNVVYAWDTRQNSLSTVLTSDMMTHKWRQCCVCVRHNNTLSNAPGALHGQTICYFGLFENTHSLGKWMFRVWRAVAAHVNCVLFSPHVTKCTQHCNRGTKRHIFRLQRGVTCSTTSQRHTPPPPPQNKPILIIIRFVPVI